MSSEEQFSLCWDNFYKNMASGMSTLLENEDLVDVTLAVEGQYLRAHKMVLSVCSPYFKELFKSNPCKHPIVFMKGVSYIVMSDLLQFMYQGEVQVSQDNLTMFIKTAEELQIKGLTGDGNSVVECESDTEIQSKHELAPIPQKVRKLSAASHRQSAKRQKLELPAVAKTEANDDQIIQFKMDSYDQTNSDSMIDDSCSDNNVFGEELDDALADDETFDEDEPKPGTSAESLATVEGHDPLDCKSKRKRNMPRYIVDGFVFHVNITKGKPPMIYLRCLEYKRLGCHARAVIPYEGSIQDIKINKPHNHPPDFAAEEKIIFMRELKEITFKKTSVPVKTIYASLSEMYPNAARETPFDTIRYKMNRWRRQSTQD